MKEPYKTFAFLNGIDRSLATYFDYSSFEDITDHATKLNLLAEMILLFARNEDYLIFLDGDAFPINPLDHQFFVKVNQHKLAAVQRVENNGDIQPHPSFCATTVGFWKQIEGSWHKGYCWKNNQGDRITDVGGNLLKVLEDNHIDWYQMRRSNKTNPHPLAFGIYGNLIYHHTIGFRKGFGGRIGMMQWGEKDMLKRLDVRILNKLIPARLQVLNSLNPYHRGRERLRKEFGKKNLEMVTKIMNDDDFYQALL